MQKFYKLSRQNFLLILIVLLASVLRLYNIAEAPPSLNWDEVSHGYNANSILKTGKDEWGVAWPRVFRAYGDYKLPAYIYLTAISESIFGLNAFAVRLPAALAGVAVVLFTYLLVCELFKRWDHTSRIALLTSLLVAIEPWSLFLSRGAFEANLALAFIVAGVYFFLIGLEKPKLLAVAAVLLGLSLWTYNSARVFVPILITFAIFLYRKKIQKLTREKRGTAMVAAIIFLLFFSPMLMQLLDPVGRARFEWVKILDEGAITSINEARGNSDLPGFLPRLVHNKATFFSQRAIANWLSHFSPQFLFFQGGSHYQFSVPGHGLIYPINGIFFLIGIFLMFKKRDRSSLFMLEWLALGFLPSSLTREAPHVLRSITVLPLPMIVTALGLVGTWKWVNENLKSPASSARLAEALAKRAGRQISNIKYLLLGIYVVLLSVSVQKYLHTYFNEYRTTYSWAWQYGYKEAVEYAKKHYGEYDKIIITKKYGEPHEFILFYWPWPPEEYHNDPSLIRFYQSNWYWVDRFDKFYFVNDWDIPKAEIGDWRLEIGDIIDIRERVLLITSPNNYPPGWKKIRTVHFLDGEPAFDIVRKDG